MPYLQQDDEEQQAGARPGAQVGFAPVGGAGPGVGAGTGAAPAATAAPAGSNWVNFQQYLDANKGTAERTGAGIASGVESGAKGAQKGIQDAQAKFQAGVAAGSPFGGSMAPAQQMPAGGPKGRGMINTGPIPGQLSGAQVAQAHQVASIRPVDAPTTTVNGKLGTTRGQALDSAPQRGGPNGGAPDPSISADEARLRAAATYTGPESLSADAGYGDLAKSTRAAQGQLDATGTASGQETLLRDKYGQQGNYTHGQSRFDQGLTNASSGDRYSQLRNQFGGLDKALSSANTASMAQAAAAKGYTSDIAGKYKGELEDHDTIEAGRQAQAQAEAEKRRQAVEYNQTDWDTVKKQATERSLVEGSSMDEQTWNSLQPDEKLKLKALQDASNADAGSSEGGSQGKDPTPGSPAARRAAYRAYIKELGLKYGKKG